VIDRGEKGRIDLRTREKGEKKGGVRSLFFLPFGMNKGKRAGRRISFPILADRNLKKKERQGGKDVADQRSKKEKESPQRFLASFPVELNVPQPKEG